MKDKIINFIMIIFALIIFAGVVFFAWIVYREFFTEDTVESIHTDSNAKITYEESKNEAKENQSLSNTISETFGLLEDSKETVSYPSENSTGNYFYKQLSDTQKKIYDGIQSNKDKLKSGTYAIEYGNAFSDTLSKENGEDTLGYDYQTAIEAFIQDNTDIFYLDPSKMFLNIKTSKKAFSTTYDVEIKPESGKTYLEDGFNSETDVNKAIREVENVRNEVKNKLTGNTYKDIKMIHDYLIDTVDYNEKDDNIGGHSIYGALVEKKCVCEGYAKAFKYLADMAGIDNVLMQGTAINSNSEKRELHAWNAVFLNNKWYLIDTTWDDPIIIGRGIVLNNVHYRYFLKGYTSFYANHTLNPQLTEGGKIFSYPTISATDY